MTSQYIIRTPYVTQTTTHVYYTTSRRHTPHHVAMHHTSHHTTPHHTTPRRYAPHHTKPQSGQQAGVSPPQQKAADSTSESDARLLDTSMRKTYKLAHTKEKKN